MIFNQKEEIRSKFFYRFLRTKNGNSKIGYGEKIKEKFMSFVCFCFSRSTCVRLASLAAGQKSGLPEQAHKVYHYYYLS